MLTGINVKPLNFNAVEVKRLSKIYSKGKTVALEEVSVNLEAGKATGLLTQAYEWEG